MVRALYVTSDAARLYLRLDVDRRALRRGVTFGVALDVLDPRRGDTRLPPPLEATWSRGAEYVLVIEPAADPRRGVSRAELFCDRGMGWSPYGRILEGASPVRAELPLRPQANDDGRFAPLIVNINRERVGRDGTIFPGIDVDMGRLTAGREPRASRGAPRSQAPRADWWLDRGRGVIEIALPWGLLNVGDPSSHAVLDDRAGTGEIETTATAGIGLLAFATTASGFRADSLGPSREGGPAARLVECQFLGPPGTRQAVVGTQVQVTSPDLVSYLWIGWERPITVERVKLSAAFVRTAFEELESRENAFHREYNALLDGRAPVRRPRRLPRRAARRR
jgi:hypothetical protein